MSEDIVTITVPAPMIVQIVEQGQQGPPGISASPNALILPISFFIDSGEAIKPGVKTWFRVPLGCRLLDWEIIADAAGSIVFDIWKSTFAGMNLPTAPTAADSICAGAKPTLSSAMKASGSPTGWTVDILAGDYLVFNVDSCSVIKRCSLALKATKDPTI